MALFSAGTEDFTGSTGFVQRTYGSPSLEVRAPFTARTEMFSPQVREIGPRLGHFFSAGTGVFHRRYGGDLLEFRGQDRCLPRLPSQGSTEFPGDSIVPGQGEPTLILSFFTVNDVRLRRLSAAAGAKGIPYKYLSNSDIAQSPCPRSNRRDIAGRL